MDSDNTLRLSQIPNDPKIATKSTTDILFNNVYPLMLSIRDKLRKYKELKKDDHVSKLEEIYALCTSQIKKTFLTMFDIFKTEHSKGIFLLESRQCTIERLSWCISRLIFIEQRLLSTTDDAKESLNDSILVTPMYFVNWIDHTFEILSDLAQVIYKTDYKISDKLYMQWKDNLVDCVSTLHMSLDELLLSAMTLHKHCLPSDQHIVKARCQVVLRESKALISELISGDLDTGFIVTPESLKLPIMPSNVNVLIDVLKDVLYVLETNTNTALLALVIHCFSYSVSPIVVLEKHFMNINENCSCQVNVDGDVEDCSFVKEFDLYNERLMQIGSFAVSCSSDQSRILSLRSGLASLEALDPHLVPALMLSPAGSHHARLLADSWRHEVDEVRDNIFLIVDPAAFAEKSKQMMHQLLLELLKESVYKNAASCDVINIGGVVADFFSAYDRLEPDAMAQRDQLAPLLADLNKVVLECKVVSNLLSSGDDHAYDVKKTISSKEVTPEQLLKRLKLLYTIVGRINSVLHPKENEELFEAEEEIPHKNSTHTVRKNAVTYVRSPRKPNMSRSVFARTNIRSSTNKLPLEKLTKHLKAKRREELSFSIQLDEMFELSEVKGTDKPFVNKQLDSIREPSILYNFSPKKRSSLRKAVLSRRCKLPFDSELHTVDDKVQISEQSDNFIDEATSLQITDILNEMTDMTVEFSKMRPESRADCRSNHRSNVLKININSDNNATITKRVWNIPVSASASIDMSTGADMTANSNATLPSNVTTMERLSDLDFLETKLNSLKTLDLETSL